MQTRRELTYRSRKILYAVITEYIATGEPVGSRKLSRRYGFTLSPATIRNELSDLEEAGYLTQPHTSAGRVPTDAGFRVFVDALVQMREVSAEDKASIVARMRELRPGEHDVIAETGKLLSALTDAAVVITAPRPEEEQLTQLRFIPLREGQLLAVLVTESGAVQNRVVPLAAPIDAPGVEQMNNFLAELLQGRSLLELRVALADQMAGQRDQIDQLRQRAKLVVEATVEGVPRKNEVIIEGQGRLFDRPEFADAEKIRSFLRTFEEKEQLLELLDRTLAAGGVHVVIGVEANLGDVQDISLISASYRKAGHATGTLAVVGPTRMDYGKLVPIVGFTARTLTELLNGDEDEGT
jgi:heat-inducible transcriptional repressor